MKADRFNLTHLIVIIAAIAGMLATPVVFAVSQCGTFEIVAGPGMNSHLAAFDDGTLWAVGSSAADPDYQVLRHFDGGSWSEQALPPEADGFVFGASGSTPDGDAWFAGSRPYSVYSVEILLMRVSNGGVDRIDRFLSPSALIDISGSSTDDVWALTARGDVFHFDGLSWLATDVPVVYQRLYPKAIYAAGPDDVWIVGYGGPGRATYIGYIQHWGGSAWTTVPTPFDGQDPSFFRDIDGSGPDDVWVVGDAGYLGEIILHWDGTTWTDEQGPASGTALGRVMTMEPGNAWAVPYSISEGDLFYYWDGATWSEGSVLDVPGAVTISWHDVAKAGLCDAWAAGAYYDGTAYQPLMTRLTPGSEPPPGNQPPVAIAQLIGPGTGEVPFNPSFSSINSYDPDGSITAWTWDFGDGTGSSVPDPVSKVYSTPGVYTVTLRVMDEEGATGSDTLTVTATDPQCTVNCLRITDDMLFQVKQIGNNYKVTARVWVNDESGSPMSGVHASATWTLPDGSETFQTVVTNQRGIARFGVRSAAGTYTLEVTDLQLAGFQFDPDNSLLIGSTSAP